MRLGLDRVGWKHLLRIDEQRDRNMAYAVRRLRMHRRTLQRVLGKRATFAARVYRDEGAGGSEPASFGSMTKECVHDQGF